MLESSAGTQKKKTIAEALNTWANVINRLWHRYLDVRVQLARTLRVFFFNKKKWSKECEILEDLKCGEKTDNAG